MERKGNFKYYCLCFFLIMVCNLDNTQVNCTFLVSYFFQALFISSNINFITSTISFKIFLFNILLEVLLFSSVLLSTSTVMKESSIFTLSCQLLIWYPRPWPLPSYGFISVNNHVHLLAKCLFGTMYYVLISGIVIALMVLVLNYFTGIW